ncbi:WhiB family transcriptional regulator [Streptomyces sp. cg36]|uniref:WhiB family transcriptional regulator n=1 Tax=Streptomyces sp. cg36 TaxID=3238798 RepID=UPI0034E2F0EB
MRRHQRRTGPAPRDREDWRHSAACRDMAPEVFFSPRRHGPSPAEVERAKAICFTCPVQPECLSWALRNKETTGVWGGMSATERRALLRRSC